MDPLSPLNAGYKEFEPYLSARSATNDVDADALFSAGLESMKISTRQYAKRQIKWIKSKLLPAVRNLENGEVTVVLLDATGTLIYFISSSTISHFSTNRPQSVDDERSGSSSQAARE
jgi:tRNA A37 N6-isopentenylltransferase MiaA